MAGTRSPSGSRPASRPTRKLASGRAPAARTASDPETARVEPDPASEPRESAGRFFREVYWLVVLSLAGVAVGFVVLPPRAVRHDQLRRFERELHARSRALSGEVAELEGVLASFDQDPFYREAAYRSVLGVKRNEERFASELPPRAPAPSGEPLPPPDVDGPADLPWDAAAAMPREE